MHKAHLTSSVAVAALFLSACTQLTGPVAGASPAALSQLTAGGRAIGPNGITPHSLANRHGWMAPSKSAARLYVSDEGDNVVDVFSVPGYSLVGQISDGVDQPEGLATDKNGYLYVSNLAGFTVTRYAPNSTTPSLTLTEPDGPDGVAVTTNGYVLAGDVDGGVDVYSPGATSPSRRLTNSAISDEVLGVGADTHGDAYAAGNVSASGYHPAIVEFQKLKGAGANLDLSDLSAPTGVLIDKNSNVVVSDYGGDEVLIYPAGSTSPSSTISVKTPDRSAVDKAENLIYVPQGIYDDVDVPDYPSGTRVTTVPVGGFTTGAALAPAPRP
jgi:hypothetical protein